MPGKEPAESDETVEDPASSDPTPAPSEPEPEPEPTPEPAPEPEPATPGDAEPTDGQPGEPVVTEGAEQVDPIHVPESDGDSLLPEGAYLVENPDGQDESPQS